MWEREKPAFPLYIFLYTLYSHMLQYRIAALLPEKETSLAVLWALRKKFIHTSLAWD